MKNAGEKGIELSTLGNRIYEKYKDFKINDYGYAQFNQYVKSVDQIRVEKAGTILIAKYKKAEVILWDENQEDRMNQKSII